MGRVLRGFYYGKQYLAIMNMLKLIMIGYIFYFMHVVLLLLLVVEAMGWTAGIRFQVGAKCSYLHSVQTVQTGSGAHKVSYPMVTGGGVLFPLLKAAGAPSKPLTPIYCSSQELWSLPTLLHMSS
jgi:hypothetical protein